MDTCCMCERSNYTHTHTHIYIYKACPSESGTDKFMQRFIQISPDIHCHLPGKSRRSTAGNNGAPTSVPLSLGHALYLREANSRRNGLIDNNTYINVIQPIPMAVQSKALVYDLLIAGTAGSNPAEGMDIRLFYLFCR